MILYNQQRKSVELFAKWRLYGWFFSQFNKKKFGPRNCCAKHEKHDRWEPGFFKEEIYCTYKIFLCSKRFCCYDSHSNKFKFKRKRLDKRKLEDCGDGPMYKYCRVLEEVVEVTSTNRGFPTLQHAVGTYEETKKGLSYFYLKKNSQQDGIHTRPLKI